MGWNLSLFSAFILYDYVNNGDRADHFTALVVHKDASYRE
jgi:hypothetical protein